MELKDVIHLYMGCELLFNNEHWKLKSVEIGINGNVCGRITRKRSERQTYDLENYEFRKGIIPIKPILRPLSDMTEDEENEIEGEWGSYGMGGNHLCNALKDGSKYVKDIRESTTLFVYLLSRHFDLFGLIESKQAIDKTTL